MATEKSWKNIDPKELTNMKILYMYEYIVCKYSISNYNVYYSLIFIGVKINSFLQRFINFDQILFGANIQNTNYYASSKE